VVACLPLSAANTSEETNHRLHEAATVFSEVTAAPDKGIPSDLISRAKCIVIVPGLKKGAFVIGAISMPICCLIMAHFPKAHLLFSVPVVSLLLAGSMTVLLVAQSHSTPNPGTPSSFLTGSETQPVSPVTD